MIDQLIFILTFLAALGCGLIAGAFFAFSTFVMRALAQLPPAQGIAAMQSINIVVINPMFMTALFGTGAACLLLAISTLFRWQRPGAGYLLAGNLLYIVGTDLLPIRITNRLPQSVVSTFQSPVAGSGVGGPIGCFCFLLSLIDSFSTK